MNTVFNYRYCDASGYSAWGEVVFAAAFDDSLLQRLIAALDGREFFIADQVRVPELFFDVSSVDDHCFHAFHRLEATDAPVSDGYGRTIEAFVAEVEEASALGWRVFDPFARQQSMR